MEPWQIISGVVFVIVCGLVGVVEIIWISIQ